LDVAGARGALDGAGAERAAERFLARACWRGCVPALDGEIQYHLERLGETGDHMLEDYARQHGLVEGHRDETDGG
jgi:hypothetical protein